MVSNSSENVKDVEQVENVTPEATQKHQKHLGPGKICYFVNHGIAPYFIAILKDEILLSDCFVVSFDESLSQVTQQCNMDLVIRVWDFTENKFQVRFWNSVFFGHGTHVDLLRNFSDGVEGFDLSKMIQVSMDGPVNLKFLEVLKKSREESVLPKVIDIGSCNLHLVHGAFKTGVKSTGWNIKSLMKGAWVHFNS